MLILPEDTREAEFPSPGTVTIIESNATTVTGTTTATTLTITDTTGAFTFDVDFTRPGRYRVVPDTQA